MVETVGGTTKRSNQMQNSLDILVGFRLDLGQIFTAHTHLRLQTRHFRSINYSSMDLVRSRRQKEWSDWRQGQGMSLWPHNLSNGWEFYLNCRSNWFTQCCIKESFLCSFKEDVNYPGSKNRKLMDIWSLFLVSPWMSLKKLPPNRRQCSHASGGLIENEHL